jgi:phenylacetate-CoA ligase
MFVHPSQVAEVLKRHLGIIKGRLVVDRQGHSDVMTLNCEVAEGGSPEQAQQIAASIREVCKLHGKVVFVAPGTLPNDGKVIDDVRQYD